MPTNHEPVPVERLPGDSPGRVGVRSRRGGRLPAELTSFVGRSRELAQVRRLLTEFPVVTLTGIGGVGKSRLAQQVAGQARAAFPDGIWYVDLTAVHDPSLLPEEGEEPGLLAHLVAIELDLGDQSPRSPLELLTDLLSSRSVLLVMDNCEHVVTACAALAEDLLRSCPGLHILATGREPLGLTGEGTFPVSPLPVPDTVPEGPDRAALLGVESAALFVARAETVLPDFEVDAAGAAAVAGICRRLDGLPLAIELAASWVPVLTPQEILDRLADRFALLRRTTRFAPDRQQTLRACVDWSYELCTVSERLLWERLSVFVGGCELDAIEGICTDDRLPAADVLAVVAGLVDKSILGREDHGSVIRYRLLETLRDYGQDRLVESGDHERMRRRHRAWYQHLVGRARAEWIGGRQGHWLDRLGRAQSNLRAAVEFGLSEPDGADAALEIAVGLPRLYWYSRGLFAEGRRWLDLGLAAQHPPRTPLHARALLLDGELAITQGDIGAGSRFLERGEQLARRLDDPAALAHAAGFRGVGALFAGQLHAAAPILERALFMVSEAPESDPELQPQLLAALGAAAALAGDDGRAQRCAEEILTITEPRGEAFWRSNAWWIQALVAWREGDLDRAVAHTEQCLRLTREMGSDARYNAALGLELLAWVAAERQRHTDAVTLLGAVDAILSDLGTSIAVHQHLLGFHRRCVAGIRAWLDGAASQAAYDRGRAMAYDDALAHALEEPGEQVAPDQGAAPGAGSPLTPREREVADLLAQGLSDAEISAALVISLRTTEGHVEKVLDKLGLASRSEVAAWVAAERDGAASAG